MHHKPLQLTHLLSSHTYYYYYYYTITTTHRNAPPNPNQIPSQSNNAIRLHHYRQNRLHLVLSMTCTRLAIPYCSEQPNGHFVYSWLFGHVRRAVNDASITNQEREIDFSASEKKTPLVFNLYSTL
jgi:hypothetical protein